MATYTAQVERDDLRLFFNACLSATAQAERDATWYEQRLALDFLHEYMRVNYRALYAKMVNLPINDFNRQQILYGLLRYPASQTHENPLIFQGLLRLPVHRVYKLFARLAQDRVNNRRTRQIIRAYVAHRNNLHFDLIKYRRLLRQILRHVHYPLSAEAYTFLFHKAWRQKVYTEPLFETFRQAHFSEKAIYQLPYTIAEGLAQRKGIPRERFLKHIRAQLSTQELIYTLFLQDYIIKNPVNDKDVEDEYTKFKKTFNEKEYLASHILLKTKNEAEDALKKLSEDADFAMLAKSKSIDHETKDNGGSLGWFRKNDMVVPIFNQVIKMSKGEVTKTPIQTKFGWHIIKLIDIKNANPPSFEEVKEELKTGLQKTKLKKYLDDLRAQAKIKIN